jgi:hypothetical protein
VRPDVAMVALKTSCKGVVLKLWLECRSGELAGVRILRDKERNAKTIKETVTYSKKRMTGQTKREIAKWSQYAGMANWVTQGAASSWPLREVARSLAFPANCRARSSPLELFFELHMNIEVVPFNSLCVRHGACNLALPRPRDAFCGAQSWDSPIAP